MGTQGKVAIVTGAAKGIGRAIAERLAADGIAVGVVDIEEGSATVRAITDAGGRAVAVVADVSKPDDVTAAVAQVERELGACTILVNNAGMHPAPPTLIADMSFDLWRRMMSIDLDSMFLFCKAVIPAMQEARWGRIVNMSSAVVNAITPPGGTHYTAAKAGVVGLTRGLAGELGEYNITVNAVAPSTVRTPGVTGAVPPGMDPEDLLKNVAASQTVKRISVPVDIANAVAFLVSDDADMFTAQILHPDGGSTRVG